MSAALCAKEKGANKKACLQFFDMATPQKEALAKFTATNKAGMKAKKKKKSKAQIALGINKK
jgi:hypothetical protein